MNVWKPTSEHELQDVIDDVPITYTEYKRSPNPFFADYLGGGLGPVTPGSEISGRGQITFGTMG